MYGCSRISTGCEHCYAEQFTHRFAGVGEKFEGLTTRSKRKAGPRWTGKILLAPERLSQPLRWARPRIIFVNSLSDVFHKEVPFTFVAAMFGVMGLAQNHVFQLLTKRHERMAEFFKWLEFQATQVDKISIFQFCLEHLDALMINEGLRHSKEDIKIPPELLNGDVSFHWPLANVWMGVSVENQEFADKRIPTLRKIPAEVRFLSMEPLVGEITRLDLRGIHWVILGGESGHGARPMDPDWARFVRDQCGKQVVPFFMKQWGQHDADGLRVRSKKAAGCLLDGIEYKEWPSALA